MKKILLILTIALVALSSCKKEDEVTTTDECHIITRAEHKVSNNGTYLIQWEGGYMFTPQDTYSKGDEYCGDSM